MTGVFKTTDGGKTWKPSLAISAATGASDLWMDPRDSNVLWATSYQRRRHVWGMVHGGPEGAIWKTTDAGATWRKIEKGIPKAELGRIGLAVSPADPDVLYALIEATDPTDRGTYRSTDRGESWTRVGEYPANGPQYYQSWSPTRRRWTASTRSTRTTWSRRTAGRRGRGSARRASKNGATWAPSPWWRPP